MVDLVGAVIVKLLADTRITAKAETRITQAVTTNFPQLPGIVVSKVSDIRDTHSSTANYSTARIQCTSYAKTDAEADELSELIADCLDTLTNTIINSRVKIVECFDAGMVPDNNPKIPIYVYHRDFRIVYQVKL